MFGLTTFAQSPFNALGGTTFVVTTSESVTFSDTYAGPVVFSGIIADSIALADSDGGGSTFDFFVTASENYSLDDLQTGLWSGGRAILESMTLTSEEIVIVNFNPELPENYTLTETQDSNVNFKPTVAETATFTDSQTGNRDTNTTTSESITLTDAQAAQVDFASLIAEGFTLFDAQSAQANFAPVIAELLTILDSQIGRGWFKINDDQSVTWTNVNNTNSSTWSNINNTQNGVVLWTNSSSDTVIWVNDDGDVISWGSAAIGGWKIINNIQ